MEPMSLTEQEAIALRGLKAAVNLAHETASNAGWYHDPQTGLPVKRNFGEVVALMQSELSEALEADRKNLIDDKLPDRMGVEVEFGDAFIRVADTTIARDESVSDAFIEVARLLQRHSITEVRFALCLFRLFAESKHLKIDVPGAIIAKNRYNRVRADHKLENRAAGGKRY